MHALWLPGDLCARVSAVICFPSTSVVSAILCVLSLTFDAVLCPVFRVVGLWGISYCSVSAILGASSVTISSTEFCGLHRLQLCSVVQGLECI